MSLLGKVLTSLGLGVMRLMAVLPLPWVRAMGALLGLLLYALVRARRKVALTNLALCFPQWSDAQRRQTARRSFIYLAQAWLDRGWLWHGSEAVLRRRLRLVGALHEFDGLAPTVVFSPHFYGLDAGATAINMNIGREFTSIYTPQANARVDEWIKAGRLRWGRVRLFQRTDGVKANVAGLRSGQVLYLLPDMDFGAEGSVFVPFFGVQAATVPSIARFARLGRAKVISVVPRMTEAGYEVQILPAWTNFPTGDLLADTARGNALLESLVLSMPAQYYWVHRRFKSRPPGQPSVY
ncbi:MAG: lipid A biosynthesis acyltransferase [Betaproteobacteria bacterium]